MHRTSQTHETDCYTVALATIKSLYSTNKIPKIWRKSRIIAILKHGKSPHEAKNFRPISLFCHCYKLFERIILNRLTPILEEKLIPQQAGFRPGKSCIGQLLNLTQYIEDGFQNNLKNGVAFIDLTAAFDSVNQRLLLNKVYNLTNGDLKLTKLLQCLLANRRFYVDIHGKKSHWRT